MGGGGSLAAPREDRISAGMNDTIAGVMAIVVVVVWVKLRLRGAPRHSELAFKSLAESLLWSTIFAG